MGDSLVCFEEIFAHACEHKGGVDNLEALLPRCLSREELLGFDDAHFLSAISRRIFRAGLKHSMVDEKWPAFEKTFFQFKPLACAMMSDGVIDAAMSNRGLIRHLGKIKTIRHNGQFVYEKSQKHGSFAAYLTSFSHAALPELLFDLKKSAAHLGGASGPSFLRMVGKDTYLFTKDVVAALVAFGVIDKAPTAKADILKAHSAFLRWHESSKRPFCEISRILSCLSN